MVAYLTSSVLALMLLLIVPINLNTIITLIRLQIIKTDTTQHRAESRSRVSN